MVCDVSLRQKRVVELLVLKCLIAFKESSLDEVSAPRLAKEPLGE